jgi:hypothetical protein
MSCIFCLPPNIPTRLLAVLVVAQLGITDVQIGLTSLEEVFLTIARKAEVEAAAGETVTVDLQDGGSLEVRGRGRRG